jgi:hypothetical protein
VFFHVYSRFKERYQRAIENNGTAQIVPDDGDNGLRDVDNCVATLFLF